MNRGRQDLAKLDKSHQLTSVGLHYRNITSMHYTSMYYTSMHYTSMHYTSIFVLISGRRRDPREVAGMALELPQSQQEMRGLAFRSCVSGRK